MQDEPIDARGPGSEGDALERLLSEMRMEHVALHLMLDQECAPIWTVRELGLALRSDVLAEEAVRALSESGLVHQLGEFVFPTQAAIRFRYLAAGG